MFFFVVAIPIRGSEYGQRLKPMEYGGFNCRGNETSLQSCSLSSSYVETWSKLFFSNHRDYAGVKCIPKTTGKLH